MTKDQSQLRQYGRETRASLDELTREVASSVIAKKVVASAWFRRAEYIGCYLSTQDEVNTWEIISRSWQMKKRVFAPICKKHFRMQFHEVTPETDLCLNRYGVFEPVGSETVTPRMLDIVIAPVVAFDREHNRIGMGGGYFDRTFSFLRHRNAWLHPKLVGLAFACQQVEEITPNPWDIRLSGTITEDEANTSGQ